MSGRKRKGKAYVRSQLKDRPLSALPLSDAAPLFSPAEDRAAAEEIPIVDPRMQKSFPCSLWRLLLTSEQATHIRAVWRIRRKESHA